MYIHTYTQTRMKGFWLKSPLKITQILDFELHQISDLLRTILPPVFQIISLHWLRVFWLQVMENVNKSGLSKKKKKIRYL